jgi:hypothetical protein
MKKITAEFILFYWSSYVREDWSVLTKAGKAYYTLPWFFRAIAMWVTCPIAIPEFFFKRSEMYEKFLLFYHTTV